MRFKKIIKMFKNGNVCVTGLRGTGKDMLFANVICRRKKHYISNFDYTSNELYFPLDLTKLDCGGNDYKNFIYNKPLYYDFSDYYPLTSDVYLSDAGIYFPSQFNGELNKWYRGFPVYQALSRQVSHNNFHINTQNLNRVWDKIREQSDIYIRCNKCIYLFGFVFQIVTIYDKYQSCVDRVEPCRIKKPLFNKKIKKDIDMYFATFCNNYGSIKRKLLFYKNKSKYDTLYFESYLKGGVKIEK